MNICSNCRGSYGNEVLARHGRDEAPTATGAGNARRTGSRLMGFGGLPEGLGIWGPHCHYRRVIPRLRGGRLGLRRQGYCTYRSHRKIRQKSLGAV